MYYACFPSQISRLAYCKNRADMHFRHLNCQVKDAGAAERGLTCSPLVKEALDISRGRMALQSC